MLDNTTLQNDTNTQNDTKTFYTDTTRATWTTGGLGVGAFILLLLTYPIWIALLSDAPFSTLYVAQAMLRLARLIVPLAIAGTYGLALLRLRRVGALQAWLEAVGLSLLYFVVTGALMGVGSYYLPQARFYLPPMLDHPWWVFTVFSDVPQMILYVAILALFSGTIAVGFALLFARWRDVRLAHLSSSWWRDFLLVFGIGSLVIFLTGFAFTFLPDRFFEIFIVPGAIAAIIASWWTYRTLYRVWQAMPAA